MKKKKYTNIILAILIVISYLMIFTSLGRILRQIPYLNNHTYTLEGLVYIIMIIYELILLKVLNKLNILKFNLKNFNKGLLVGGFLVFMIITGSITYINEGLRSGNETKPIIDIIIFTITILFGTGFTEEILCRGIIENLMFDTFGRNTKKGIYLSIIISSLLFGLAHFINYFTVKASFSGVLTQVIFATFIGCYLASIYARCHNIWPLIIMHGTLDFIQMIGEGIWGIGDTTTTISNYQLSSIIPSVIIYSLLVLFLLRKSKIKECYANEKDI